MKFTSSTILLFVTSATILASSATEATRASVRQNEQEKGAVPSSLLLLEGEEEEEEKANNKPRRRATNTARELNPSKGGKGGGKGGGGVADAARALTAEDLLCGVEITDCDIELTQDIECPKGEGPILIGVNLDCNGFTISGNYPAESTTFPSWGARDFGVTMEEGASIKNCNIEGFDICVSNRGDEADQGDVGSIESVKVSLFYGGINLRGNNDYVLKDVAVVDNFIRGIFTNQGAGSIELDMITSCNNGPTGDIAESGGISNFDVDYKDVVRECVELKHFVNCSLASTPNRISHSSSAFFNSAG